MKEVEEENVQTHTRTRGGQTRKAWERRALLLPFTHGCTWGEEKPCASPRSRSSLRRNFSVARERGRKRERGVITCIFDLNSYLFQLIFMLILYNYNACYHSFMNFLHWCIFNLNFLHFTKVHTFAIFRVNYVFIDV